MITDFCEYKEDFDFWDTTLRVLYEDAYQKIEGRYSPEIITLKKPGIKLIKELLNKDL